MKKILTFCLLTFICFEASAQATKSNTAKFIENKEFVFIPTRVSPSYNGRTDLIGDLYFLSIKPDTITTYLPSFGINGIDGPGILTNRSRAEYQSVKFDYKSVKTKNGAWDISINFKDTPGAIEVRMMLWVNKNGYGTLTINKTSERTRTYYGYLKASDQRSLAK